MFANCSMPGMDIGIPDVCLTPLAAGIPVPVPYPNIAIKTMAIPPTASMKHLLCLCHPITFVPQPPQVSETVPEFKWVLPRVWSWDLRVILGAV